MGCGATLRCLTKQNFHSLHCHFQVNLGYVSIIRINLPLLNRLFHPDEGVLGTAIAIVIRNQGCRPRPRLCENDILPVLAVAPLTTQSENLLFTEHHCIESLGGYDAAGFQSFFSLQRQSWEVLCTQERVTHNRPLRLNFLCFSRITVVTD